MKRRTFMLILAAALCLLPALGACTPAGDTPTVAPTGYRRRSGFRSSHRVGHAPCDRDCPGAGIRDRAEHRSRNRHRNRGSGRRNRQRHRAGRNAPEVFHAEL